MLKYIGSGRYETHLEDGSKIELSCNDVENIVREGIKIGGIQDKLDIVLEEDYEMMVSENAHLAQWIKTRTMLSDEKIALIAQTGTFAKDADSSERLESDTTE